MMQQIVIGNRVSSRPPNWIVGGQGWE